MTGIQITTGVDCNEGSPVVSVVAELIPGSPNPDKLEGWGKLNGKGLGSFKFPANPGETLSGGLNGTFYGNVRRDAQFSVTVPQGACKNEVTSTTKVTDTTSTSVAEETTTTADGTPVSEETTTTVTLKVDNPPVIQTPPSFSITGSVETAVGDFQDTGRLPSTGADGTTTMVIFAGGFLVIGGLLLAARRRIAVLD